ncbi:MAG: proton-conducting transporter membrane subunit [candidate division KSB1 bacterium]|nr:proton-conducting transporter membrane subunit [candidate division KSB1 bacterium]
MNPITLFESSVVILLAGAGVALVLGGRRQLVGQVSFVFTLLASICLAMAAVRVLATGTSVVEAPLLSVPALGANLLLRIDALSAVFLLLIALLGTMSALYAVRFMALPAFNTLSLRAFYPFYLVFLAAISCIVASADLFFFFIFWEVMTLTSYVLVIFHKDQAERTRAGFKYFFMTHVATALMFIGAIIVYQQSRSFAFSDLGDAMLGMLGNGQARLLHIALAFFFIGFATKAGILPFGDWLPDAYPAAPAPAAATFGGIMSKIGLYGLVRVFFVPGPVPSIDGPWGVVMALFGTLSIFLGSMTALAQDDTKKLLSFSVVGQMGYLLLGIGIGLYFLPTAPTLAIIALVAAVFHLVSNVLFKSCLFYNAGSIYYRAGTRDLNKVGGLSRLMPVSATTAVLAGLSMAGMPLLVGFSSKWLFFQASLQAGVKMPLFMLLALIALFISVVTLAYAAKFFGMAFFGKFNPGQAKAGEAEVPLSMVIPQVVMAGMSVVIGILPWIAVGPVQKGVLDLVGEGVAACGTPLTVGGVTSPLLLDLGTGPIAAWSPLVILVAGAICFLLSWSLFRAGAAPVREDATWYCGEVHSDEEVRYKAQGLYLSFKQFFKIRIGAYEQPGVYPQVRYPRVQLSEQNLLRRILNVDNWFFYPLTQGFMSLMRYFSGTHVGIPHVYLLWLVIGVLLAIFILFALAGGGV